MGSSADFKTSVVLQPAHQQRLLHVCLQGHKTAIYQGQYYELCVVEPTLRHPQILCSFTKDKRKNPLLGRN